MSKKLNPIYQWWSTTTATMFSWFKMPIGNVVYVDPRRRRCSLNELRSFRGKSNILRTRYPPSLHFMRGPRNFRQGGGGGSRSVWQKKLWQCFFILFYFIFFFFSPQLILLKSNGQFQRNLSFFKVPKGVQHFPGGGGRSNVFQGGGSNCLFPRETHITWIFQGGPDPLSPLLICTWVACCRLTR